jgi:hypothetical protein
MQGWSADEVPGDVSDSYTACGQLHLVNRANGRVLGVQDRE